MAWRKHVAFAPAEAPIWKYRIHYRLRPSPVPKGCRGFRVRATASAHSGLPEGRRKSWRAKATRERRVFRRCGAASLQKKPAFWGGGRVDRSARDQPGIGSTSRAVNGFKPPLPSPKPFGLPPLHRDWPPFVPAGRVGRVGGCGIGLDIPNTLSSPRPPGFWAKLASNPVAI